MPVIKPVDVGKPVLFVYLLVLYILMPTFLIPLHFHFASLPSPGLGL